MTKTKRNTNVASSPNGKSNNDDDHDNDDDDDHDHDDDTSMKIMYTCISCLQPSPILYRQYSTAHNIKLQPCLYCADPFNQNNFSIDAVAASTGVGAGVDVDVDHYIEYELLLVCMDLLLYRKCAYRHLLFNRSLCNYDGSDTSDNGNGNSNGKEQKQQQQQQQQQQNTFFTFICTTKSTVWNGKRNLSLSSNVIIYVMMIVLLRTILKFQSLLVAPGTGLGLNSALAEVQVELNVDYDPDNENIVDDDDDTCYYYYPYLHPMNEINMDKLAFSTTSTSTRSATATTSTTRITSTSTRAAAALSQFKLSSSTGSGSEQYCYTFLPIFTALSMLSMFEYAILYFGTLLSTKFAARHIHMAQLQRQKQDHKHTNGDKHLIGKDIDIGIGIIDIARDIYLAIFLPQLFHIVTLLVHIYESSSTVRFIGSFFTFSIMYISVHCVVERIVVRLTTSTTRTNTSTSTSTSQITNIICAENKRKDEGNADKDATASTSTTARNAAAGSKVHQLILFLSRIIPGWPLLLGLFLKLIVPQLVFMILFHWSSKVSAWTGTCAANSDEDVGVCNSGMLKWLVARESFVSWIGSSILSQ